MPTQNFKVGEMLNKRTQNSKTWMNFDGSYTTEIHSGVVHYQDVNGNLQNIDTDLHDEADFDSIDFPVAKDGDSLFFAAQEKAVKDKKRNRLNRDNFDFQGLKVPFEAKLPRNIKRGYSIGKGASKLKFIPVEASPSKGYVEGNKITYADVWNDADLILEVLPNGIKETIILKSERAPFNFSFEVQGELDSELKIQPPWLQDAIGTKRDVVQGVEAVDGKTVVSLAADVTGLVYPIEIDPTVTIQPEGAAGIDTYINSGQSTINSGTSASIYTGRSMSSIYRTLIKFDLSAIPQGSGINSGALSLYMYASGGTTGTSTQAHEITSTWSEGTVTWNTQPTINETLLSSVRDDTGLSTFYSFDVKLLLQSWVNGSKVNNGVMLKSSHESIEASWREWVSSDNATALRRPKLSVTYDIPPTAPTVLIPNGGETWNSLHTVEWQAATDTLEVTTYSPTALTGSGIYSGSVSRMGQPFQNPSAESITRIGISTYNSSGSPQNLKLELVGIDSVTGLPNGTVYASGNVVVPTQTTNGFVYYSLPSPFSIPAGTWLAVQFIGQVSLNINISIGTKNLTWGRYYTSNGSDTKDPSNGLVFAVDYQRGLQQDLKYQIQLSTNNGATWKDIVALTASGATSYTYDFINEAESSTAKIRIRAYDGSAYGPWDESNGVFTIQHNQAPTAPTNLAPSSGVKDRAIVNRLSWQHNDANADPQAKFDLQWRFQGASTWNTVSQSTINQYYDAPANTFPKGTTEWQVRTYDQAGLSSPYSATATFFAGDKPAMPTIVSPGSTVAVANPTVQWSSVDQVGYLLTVKTTGGTTVFSSEKTSGNKAETVTYNLANQTAYDIELSIKNADGLYSNTAKLRINVSYTPPAIPDIETVEGSGFIQINITDRVPTGTQPAVTSHDIYKEIDGEFVLIATGVAAEFKDYQVASNENIRYFVRTFGNNGTFSDTITFSTSIKFIGVWLHIVVDPSTLSQFKYDGDGRGTNWALENAVHHFAGRRNPVMEVGIMEDYAINFSLKLLDDAQRAALERIVYSGETVCYRDGRGRKSFGVFVDVPFNDESWRGYSTDLTLMKIDFKEAIE